MNDIEIIVLYNERNENAIVRTQEKYGRYCYTIAWNVLNDHEDSSECVNDTWLDTWNAIPPARPFSLKAFVGRITRNNALNRLEKNRALKRGGGGFCVCIDELGECLPGDDPVGTFIDHDHLVTILNDFLSHLKKEQRMIFVRRYWYGSPLREIADCYGLSESKVKVTLMRLRNRLKERLEKEGVSL